MYDQDGYRGQFPPQLNVGRFCGALRAENRAQINTQFIFVLAVPQTNERNVHLCLRDAAVTRPTSHFCFSRSDTNMNEQSICVLTVRH